MTVSDSGPSVRYYGVRLRLRYADLMLRGGLLLWSGTYYYGVLLVSGGTRV